MILGPFFFLVWQHIAASGHCPLKTASGQCLERAGALEEKNMILVHSEGTEDSSVHHEGFIGTTGATW